MEPVVKSGLGPVESPPPLGLEIRPGDGCVTSRAAALNSLQIQLSSLKAVAVEMPGPQGGCGAGPETGKTRGVASGNRASVIVPAHLPAGPCRVVALDRKRLRKASGWLPCDPDDRAVP
jgi:hypothetical protein